MGPSCFCALVLHCMMNSRWMLSSRPGDVAVASILHWKLPAGCRGVGSCISRLTADVFLMKPRVVSSSLCLLKKTFCSMLSRRRPRRRLVDSIILLLTG